MAFLYPSFLWALAAVLVPVIIHLFNFRKYKKVYFSNVKFLRELQLESKSRSRLKELLILAARCLAVAALALAFARPFMPGEETAGVRKAGTVSIYLDNSFSMENLGRQGRLFDLARQRAKEIVKAEGGNTRFYILTNDFAGGEQRLRTQDNALTYLDELGISPTPRLLSSALGRQSAFLRNANVPASRVYVFSDAQKSTFDLDACAPDTASLYTLIPFVFNEVNNIYLDSCWFQSPVLQKGFRQRLFASVKNNGNSPIEAGSAKLYVDNKQVALSTFSVNAGATASLSFSFWQNSPGFSFGRVEIEDYPITFDDRLYFAYDARVDIRVTLINGTGQEPRNPFSALFSNDSIFSLRAFAEQGIDYGAFANSDVILLNQLTEISSGLLSELTKFAASGGCIVIIPDASPDQGFNQSLTALNLPVLGDKDTAAVNTASIDLSSGFFEGVFEKMEARVSLPQVNTHFSLGRRPGAALDRIMTLANGKDLLVSAPFQNATVFLFTSPLLGEHSNFSRHALFVPAMFRIALASISQPPAYYDLTGETVISVRADLKDVEQPPHIIGVGDPSDIIPEKRQSSNRMLLFPRGQLNKPGYYVLRHGNDSLMPLAFNYARVESDLRAYGVEELRQLISERGWKNVRLSPMGAETLQSALLAGDGDRQLWKLFILLALVFFLAEVLLLRFLK
jgi:hypothetical protein